MYMIYIYKCSKCDQECEVIKHHTEIDNVEHCETCNQTMSRIFRPKIHLSESIKMGRQDPYYHPALGEVVKNDKDASLKAKHQGMIEVGNEKPEKFLKPTIQEY